MKPPREHSRQNEKDTNRGNKRDEDMRDRNVPDDDTAPSRASEDEPMSDSRM